MTYTRAVELASGQNVTVQAWTLADIAANTADFYALLELIASPFDDQAQGGTPELFRVAERSIRLSLTRPEDATLVRAPDIPELLDAIFEVNGLADLVKKTMRLRLKLKQAQAIPSTAP